MEVVKEKDDTSGLPIKVQLETLKDNFYLSHISHKFATNRKPQTSLYLSLSSEGARELLTKPQEVLNA